MLPHKAVTCEARSGEDVIVRALSKNALMGVSLIALTAPMQAMAQAAPAPTAPAEPAAEGSDVVVVGTLIRGTTAVGSQTISVDSKAITAQGATSTNELLGLIPQIASSFNGRFEGDPRGVSAGISVNRPNLRNLPSANTTSGALTLVLMDGMRLTPVGVNQASVDVDIIPAAVIEGVDAVTDGGSSLYGADAVTGVLNFRTMRKFDGIKVDGNFGFGTTIKGFSQWDGSITAGHSWSSGNAYISAGHSDRDGIVNGQTSWSNGIVYNAAGVASTPYTQCNTPQPTETRWYRFGAGAANFTNNPAAPGAGTFALGTGCDQISSRTYLPHQTRTNVFAVVSQQVADNIDLRVTGYWTKRNTELVDYPRGFTSAGSPLTTGALVGAAFPGAAVGSLTAVPAGTGFSFGPNAAYVNTPTRLGFETWGVTPELTIKLGGNWQVRNSLHFGRSTNFQSFPDVNTIAAQGYINSGALNPSNVAAASAAVINDITNYENAQDTTQQLFIFRTVADGPLFALPGGDAKLAVGVEYQDNSANSRLTAGTVGSLAALPYMKAERNSKSVFAEISLPLASFVDVSGSVRYDNYSDFGSTTNPNIGLTLKPTSWLKFFGHWNTSFNAPTALDGLAIGTGRFVCGIYVVGGTAAQRPTDPLGRDTSKQGTCAMVLQGSSPGLKPQTAHSWAVGFEAKPVRGLRFGAEFYALDLRNTLGTLNPSIISTYTTNPDLYTYNVSDVGYKAILAQLTNGTALGGQQPLASNIAIVVDTRTSNLNAAKFEGVDFHIFYDTDTNFGHLAFGVSGTEQTRSFQTNGGVATNELGHGNARLFVTSFVGWNKGPFSTRVTVNYTGAFHDIATNNLGVSEDVHPFVVTNLFLGYNFENSGGPLSGTSLRLTVDNLFEEKPQTIRRINTNNLTYNNWTLGRVIKFGVSKKF
jgi:iron complex outermembrane receptor protein